MLAVPPPYDKPAWSREDALVEIVRGRLEGLGPVVPDELARCLGLTASELAAPLAALETEGFAMRGRFTPGANGEEWCERRLLSRIHHYTLKRLRAEIEPVAARDFLRFLFDWQHLSADARMTGPKALDRVVAQLEGFEAPAAAWESDILPARLVGYESGWLDERCLAGQIAWMRLRTRNGRSGGKSAPVRSTPIALLPRRHAGIWMSANSRDAAPHLSFRAQLIADCIKEHGASFFDELMDVTGLLRSQIEEGLAELVALGLVTSDSFGGLRALLVPSSERRTGTHGRRRRRAAAYGVEDPLDAGRMFGGPSQLNARRTRPSMSLARYWRATASYSGGSWSVRPRGCRRGASCSAPIAGSKVVAKSAAAASSLASRASSSRCRRRLECSAERGGGRRPINGCPCLARIPST